MLEGDFVVALNIVSGVASDIRLAMILLHGSGLDSHKLPVTSPMKNNPDLMLL
jgi:hypothetical protein